MHDLFTFKRQSKMNLNSAQDITDNDPNFLNTIIMDDEISI